MAKEFSFEEALGTPKQPTEFSFEEALVPPKAPTERTWGESFKDIGAGVVSGTGSLVQLPGQLYGLATGDFSDTGTLGMGKAIEQYNDDPGLEAIDIRPVKKTFFMDLVASGWDPKLTKPEDMAIVNDSTLVVGIDNDYGIESTHEGVVSATGEKSVMYVFSLKGANKIGNYIAPVNTMFKEADITTEARK